MVLERFTSCVGTLTFMRRLTFLAALCLSTLSGFAASPSYMFSNTNQLIAVPVPRVNTNLWSVLSGHTNKNDGWGGLFEFVTNTVVDIDWTNGFPSSVANSEWRRVVQPVGTNAPASLTVQGNFRVNSYVGIGDSASVQSRIRTSDTVEAQAGSAHELRLAGGLKATADDDVLTSLRLETSYNDDGFANVDHWAIENLTGAGMYLGTGLVRLPGLAASRVLLIDANGDIASMGAPAADGYILSSTIAGVKSWVANAAGSTGGTPTVLVGLTATTGAASTFIATDSAPALDQSISPTWIGIHKYTNNTSTASIQLVKSDSTHVPLTFKKASLSVNLFQVGLAGYMYWGNGTDALDTFLYRTGAGHLKTTGDVTIGGLSPDQPVFTDANSKLVSVSPVPYANLPVQALSSQYTSVGNVGAGVDDLMTYTLPAGKLASDGDRLEIRASITTANNANTKNLDVLFSGSVLSLGSLAAQDEISIIYEAIRRNSGSVRVSLQLVRNSGSVQYPTDMGVTLANAAVIKFTGEGVADNDIVQKTMTVTYYKAP